ncbi:MAG: hypothetical protein ACK4KV_19745 [Rhodocyclaceae bacterium]
MLTRINSPSLRGSLGLVASDADGEGQTGASDQCIAAGPQGSAGLASFGCVDQQVEFPVDLVEALAHWPTAGWVGFLAEGVGERVYLLGELTDSRVLDAVQWQ